MWLLAKLCVFASDDFVRAELITIISQWIMWLHLKLQICANDLVSYLRI